MLASTRGQMQASAPANGLLLLQRFQTAQIIRRVLIHIVVQPVRVQQIPVGAPAEQRVAARIVVGVVVAWDVDGLAGLHIALILPVQGIFVVLGVADDKDLPPGLGGKQHRPGNVALGQNA